MNKVVFDVESLAYPLESFDKERQDYLLRFASTEEERAEAILKMALSPFTARVVAVAMLNPDSNQGKVFFEGPGLSVDSSPDGSVEFVPLDETGILEEFWKTISRYSQFITFNGRMFDCPFLMLRSALLGVRPSRNLMPYRYSAAEHCDLLEQLTFYGAGRKFSLDFYSKSFGIPSPKAEGVSGLDVGTMFQEGRYHEIAEYCMRDVRATAELYQRWASMLTFEK